MGQKAHKADPFSHSMTDLMAGVAVTFLLVAAIFMVQAFERSQADAAQAKAAKKQLLEIKSTDKRAIDEIKDLRDALQRDPELQGVIALEYDKERDPFLLTIVFDRGRLRFNEGECAIRDDARLVMNDSFGTIFKRVCKTANSGYVQSITLEGHTDNNPFYPAQAVCGVDRNRRGCRPSRASEEPCKSIGFANNVRLSAARAQNVFFTMREILADAPEIAECLDTRFIVAGRGPTNPANGESWESPQSDKQREENRRVIIKVRATSRTREAVGQ